MQICKKKQKKKLTKSKNNAIFCKSLENSVNKVDVKIAGFRKQYQNWSFRPTFQREKNS